MALLNEGDYRAKAIEAQLGTTSTGKEQIAVRFALLDFPNQTITWYGFFTDAAFEITMRGLRAAGFKGNDFDNLSSLSEEASPEVVIVVVHETYKDKVSAKVKFINGQGGLALQGALQPDQAKAFAAKMKGRVLAYDQSSGLPAAKPGAPAPRPAKPNGAASSEQIPQHVLDAQAEQQGEDAPY
jgi:hypothetical protein